MMKKLAKSDFLVKNLAQGTTKLDFLRQKPPKETRHAQQMPFDIFNPAKKKHNQLDLPQISTTHFSTLFAAQPYIFHTLQQLFGTCFSRAASYCIAVRHQPRTMWLGPNAQIRGIVLVSFSGPHSIRDGFGLPHPVPDCWHFCGQDPSMRPMQGQPLNTTSALWDEATGKKNTKHFPYGSCKHRKTT